MVNRAGLCFVWFFLALILPACTTAPSSPTPQASASLAVAAPSPVPTVDAGAAGRLVAGWRALGLNAEVEYKQVPAQPVDRIEWKVLNVVLPEDQVQMEGVMTTVGQFAARAAQPVMIHLYVRNRKQDGQLSQALKKGAIESGGRNSVKLDHHIRPDFQPRVQLSVREGTQ